jgi:hypothetical protein
MPKKSTGGKKTKKTTKKKEETEPVVPLCSMTCDPPYHIPLCLNSAVRPQDKFKKPVDPFLTEKYDGNT